MLWYGYIYYALFSILFIILVLVPLRMSFAKTLVRLTTTTLLTGYFLSGLLFIFLLTLLSLNSTLTYYQHSLTLMGNTVVDINYIGLFLSNSFLTVQALNLNLVQVYFYPFIYVFLLVTVLSILICLSYNSDELSSFISYCIIVLVAGYVMFFTDSLILFFMSYELLLVPSFFILYKFAKTRRCVEAAYLMFFWTQFGALFLILAFVYLFLVSDSSLFSVITLTYLSNFEVNFIFLCCFIGFGVKLPLWPFYGWLPKAHVEASTNFSIFLSGVLVKFAFFGLLKCLFTIQLEPTFIYVYPFLIIGIVDATFKLFYQIDLKKLVAYATVIEMHWLTVCIISGQSNLLLANFCMLISHALLSTNSFLLVDAVTRRFKTRLISEISGINMLCPKLFIAILLNSLIFLGFPGSLFFISEVLFFTFVFDLFPIMTLFLIILLYLLAPTFFFRSWFNLMFGKSKALASTIPVDLSTREYTLFFGIPLLMYWLGVSWQAFVV